MGQVAATIKIMPEGPETDLEAMKKEITVVVEKAGIELKGIEEKPVAFGLKCLEVLIVMPDQGGTDAIEEALKNIKDVASVEAGEITLL